MTISITRRLKKFIGNGSATDFSYDFYIPDADSVYVVLYNTVTGERTVLNDAEFDITGLGDPAFGEVTYPLVGDPISSDYWLIVVRQVDYVQDLNIPNQSTFYPEVLEAKLDDLVMMVQQLAEVQSRTIRAVEGDTIDLILEDAGLRANKYLRFDAGGEPAASELTTVALPIASADEVDGPAMFDDPTNESLMTPLRTKQAFDGLTGDAVRGHTDTLADDAVKVIETPKSDGFIFVTPFGSLEYAVLWFRADDTPARVAISAGSDVATGTGPLSAGASGGTDNKFNIFVDTGFIYLKNRLGTSRSVQWIII